MRNRSRRNSSLNKSGSSERQPNGAVGWLSSAALEGLRSESSSVWFDRGAYERAESLYYVRLLQEQNGTTSPASFSDSSRKPETCRHQGQEACHHVVQDVWVNKPNFDQAESKFVGRIPNQPRSLQLQPVSQTPSDEGYQSQTPTPPTPASKPINGLPCLTPPPMGVWLQKPLFDRAEASFYQNLYSRNSPPKTSSDESSSKRRNNDVAAQKKPVVCDHRDSDDVKANQGAAMCYFLHPDSERVWLDRGRYVEAETRFYEGVAAKSLKTSVNHSSRKQKYDSILQRDCTHFPRTFELVHSLMPLQTCITFVSWTSYKSSSFVWRKVSHTGLGRHAGPWQNLQFPFDPFLAMFYSQVTSISPLLFTRIMFTTFSTSFVHHLHCIFFLILFLHTHIHSCCVWSVVLAWKIHLSEFSFVFI